MSFDLFSITFNYDVTSFHNSAMNVRRNKNIEIQRPEYREETSGGFVFNCAAYSIADTKRNKVYIRVHFVGSSDAPRAWEVKAVGGGVMGPIDPIAVNLLPRLHTQSIDIPLDHRNFSKVGVYDITWRWFYRRSGELEWAFLKETSHRIFLVLKVPPQPWTQTYADSKNPWTELMEKCCALASNTKNSIDATRRITKAINNNYQLRYDIGSGAPRYNFGWGGSWTFNLESWIDYVLNGNVPQNPRFCQNTPEDYPDFKIVNCYDCGGSLSLMAKIIGANVEYNYHSPFGKLNYVYPIGRGKGNNPFPSNHCSGTGTNVGPNDFRSGFGNHAYTKLGSKVFDACMKVFVSSFEKFILSLIIILLFIITLGQADLTQYFDRYNGWLINLSQSDYDTKVIDTSEPFEAASAGGQPTPNNITF